MSEVRTRFAPSPTGYLHIGGARTALFSWLYARKMGGKFFLRIEDTDKARSTDENTRLIYEGMKWLGLNWDNEKPILQSDRTEIYREHVQKLLAEGKAYKCYCTPEELEAKRKAALEAKKPQRYDRTCRRRAQNGDTTDRRGQPFVVRAAFDETGATVVDDLIKGPVAFQNEELSDEVILRADGGPLYNLCVVVDDHEMGITHVLRGDDHLNNTPKQLQLYKAFGYAPPKFGHMPLIFDMQGKKVSKRSGTVVAEVHRYQEMGYLPEAMINFLARLGWSLDDTREDFTLDELIQVFSIEGIGKAPAKFDIKRLVDYDKKYLAKRSVESLVPLVTGVIERKGWKVPDRATLERMIAVTQTRSETVVHMVEQCAFWFVDPPAFDEKAVEKNLKGKGALLDEASPQFLALPSFDKLTVDDFVTKTADAKQLKKKEIGQLLRVALTGVEQGPPLEDIAALLGKDRVARRFAEAKSRA